jgi:methylglyoxal synthase
MRSKNQEGLRLALIAHDNKKVGAEIAQPHEPDITALLRVCDVHDIPVATNVATAEMLLEGLCQKEADPSV